MINAPWGLTSTTAQLYSPHQFQLSAVALTSGGEEAPASAELCPLVIPEESLVRSQRLVELWLGCGLMADLNHKPPRPLTSPSAAAGQTRLAKLDDDFLSY